MEGLDWRLGDPGEKVGGLAQQLPDIVKRVLGIHSPSKVFDEIGVTPAKVWLRA